MKITLILRIFLYRVAQNTTLFQQVIQSTSNFVKSPAPRCRRRLTTSFSPALFLSGLLVLFLFAPAEPVSAQDGQPTQSQQTYTINDQVYSPASASSGYKETGLASWYGYDFNGRSTFSGETYDMNEPTAAHKQLPMNTMLLVSNLENGKKTIVRVNDRGPYVRGRIIDLSYTAAKKLDLVNNGTARVRVTTLAKSAPAGLSDARDNKGEFYIQIGALKEKTDPFKLQKRFADADTGQTTVIRELLSGKSILYRVCVYAGQELHGSYRVEDILHLRGLRGAFEIAR